MKKFEGFQKGVNLGGWISQFSVYDHKHFKTFITREDIAYIASLGFDHVRVPVDYNVLEDEDGQIKPSGFSYLESCFAWCREFGLHMLIDLHECYGYSFDPLKKDMDRRKFFYDAALQDRFLALWTEIARQFGGYPDQVAFEPLNEVVLFEVADAWNALIKRYIETIRAVAPRTWIVVGGVNYNNVLTVKLLEAPTDDRIVYNFHCYEPMVFSHQGAYWMDVMPRDYRVSYPQPLEVFRREHEKIFHDTQGTLFLDDIDQMGPDYFERIFKEALAYADQNDVPLYCGEYGVIDLADNPSKLRWLRDIHAAFDRCGIGRALWNYKEKDFGFVDDRFREIQADFIKIL